MDSAARLRQRADKLRDQLDNLKKEVNVANVILQQILDRSVSLVEEIESVKSTQIYLREYSKVQKCLLNYVNSVTEINCNLEMLTEEDDTEIQTDDSNSVFTPPPPPNNTAQTNVQVEEIQPEVKKPVDPKTEFKEKIEKLAKEDPDPKTEFREKVKQLVEEDSKESEKADTKPEPKSWTEAPPFVPKATGEAAYVSKSMETPQFVPNVTADVTSLVQKNVSINFGPKFSFVPNPGFYAPRIRQVVSSPMGPYTCPVYYNMPPSSQPPPTVSIISWNPPLAPQPPYQQPQYQQQQQQQQQQFPPPVTRRPLKIEAPKSQQIKILAREEGEKLQKVSEASQETVETAMKVEAKIENVEKVEKAEKVEKVKKVNESEKVENKTVAAEKPKKVKIPDGGSIPDMEISRKPGMKYQVVFDHLVSPAEFYVQVLCPALSSMREMNKEIEAYFKSEKPPEQPYQSNNLADREKKKMARNEIGKYGLCFTVDDPSWGRVEVLDWNEEENNDVITVFFVDYGDTKTVTLGNIQPMLEKFRKYPKFAQRCHLADVYPPEAVSGKPMPPWSSQSMTMFEILLESMPHDFSCHIIVEENDGCHVENSLPVTFFVHDNGISSSINDRMVEFESAKKLDRPPLPPDPNMTFSPPTKKVNVGDLKVAPSPKLRIGQILSIQVTCLLKLNRFYCVRQGEEEEDDLAKLVQLMNEPVNVKGMLPFNDPAVGELAIGKYKEDNLWYRAKIVKADPENDRYKLLFLDYGNSEIMSKKDIRKMEKKFLGFPFQLIECFLYGVEPSEGKTEEGMTYFYEKVDKGGLSVKICEVISETNSSYEVELYDIKGNDIGKDLIDNKFAKPKKT